MHGGAARQTEHRRGLVLGLTLAETLLLLLFLLLLAFGSALADLEKKEHTARAKLDEFVRAASSESDRARVDQLLQTIVELKRQIELHRSANEKRVSELSKYAAYDEAIREAAQINPDDPPAALRRGLVFEKRNIAVGTRPGRSAEPTGTDSAGRHNWPPIIRLSDADGYFFRSGSAELAPEFRSKLTGPIVATLLDTIKAYDVNVIEVIGHTDEQPLAARASNLDKATSAYLAGTSNEALVSADNAGLGFARAVSVVRALRAEPRLVGLSILPLSGAQLIDLGDRLSADGAPAPAEERRRIEIRVRRSDAGTASPSQTGSGQWIPSVTTTRQTSASAAIVGQAVVVDGDTIDVGATRVRIWGIDAIESGQTCTLDRRPWDCASNIKAALAKFLAGKDIVCTKKSTDRHGRTVAL